MKLPNLLEWLKPGGRRTLLSSGTGNELIGVVRALQRLEIEGFTPFWSDSNVRFERGDKTREPESGESGSSLALYRVESQSADYLTCRTYRRDEDGSETIGGTDILIAKPYGLQASQFDGTTIDGRSYAYVTGAENYRTVTIETDPDLSVAPSGYEELWEAGVELKEKIWPEYIDEFSIIVAAKLDERPLVPDTDIEWIDLNIDGRHWEMLWHDLRICIEDDNGDEVRQRVLVRSSQPFD